MAATGSEFASLLPRALAAVALFLSTSCTKPSDLPTSQIFMLVDVSETYHNELDDARNLAVLTEAGMGAALAADELSSESGSPVSVQLRIIGSQSLERLPACDVVYVKQLFRSTNERAYQLSSIKDLKQYLGKDCPEKVLGIDPEAQTEISNALISVANQLSVGVADRKIIIMSDFLEEAVRPVSPVDLSGFSILMIYRPLKDDQINPAEMHARVAKWKENFSRLGATVRDVPDTGIKREVIAAFLKLPPPAVAGTDK